MMRLWKNQTIVPIIKQAAHDSTLDLCLWMYNNLPIDVQQRVTHADHTCFRNIETGEGIEHSFMYQSQQTSASLSLSPRCQQNTRARHRLKWGPPPVGELQLDVDVCVINEQYSGRLGIGGIVRDGCGSPILAFGRKIDFSESVIECELRAIKEGLKVCHNAGFFPTIICSGSLLAVQAIINEESRSCVVDVWLVAGIKRLLEMVNGTHLEFAHRSSNFVAYSIAKFVCFSHTNFVWVAGDFPYWLEELVNGDIST